MLLVFCGEEFLKPSKLDNVVNLFSKLVKKSSKL